ncbi:hypothetical protein L9F63_006857, partial [Diploptera punctata]
FAEPAEYLSPDRSRSGISSALDVIYLKYYSTFNAEKLGTKRIVVRSFVSDN